MGPAGAGKPRRTELTGDVNQRRVSTSESELVKEGPRLGSCLPRRGLGKGRTSWLVLSMIPGTEAQRQFAEMEF